MLRNSSPRISISPRLTCLAKVDTEICGEHYYAETDAVIFVVDSSDRMRLVVSSEEFDSMLNHSTFRNRNKIPILIFANKSDIKGAISSSGIRDELNLDKIQNRPWRIFPSNALNGDGISEGIEWLIQELKIRF